MNHVQQYTCRDAFSFVLRIEYNAIAFKNYVTDIQGHADMGCAFW